MAFKSDTTLKFDPPVQENVDVRIHGQDEIRVHSQHQCHSTLQKQRRITDGGQGRNRTTDTRIFSPLLYRLSYLARTGEFVTKLGFKGASNSKDIVLAVTCCQAPQIPWV